MEGVDIYGPTIAKSLRWRNLAPCAQPSPDIIEALREGFGGAGPNMGSAPADPYLRPEIWREAMSSQRKPFLMSSGSRTTSSPSFCTSSPRGLRFGPAILP